MPGTVSASARTRSVASRSSPRTSTSVSISAIDRSARCTAETWWKAAVTRDSGSSFSACWAALPSSTGSANGPCLSKPSGFTQSITILPTSWSRSASSSSAWPSHGTATSTTSAAAAQPALSCPVTRSVPDCSFSSAAAVSARSAFREPITTRIPPRAQRSARPLPCGPVPPSTPTVSCVTSVKKSSIGHQTLRPSDYFERDLPQFRVRAQQTDADRLAFREILADAFGDDRRFGEEHLRRVVLRAENDRVELLARPVAEDPRLDLVEARLVDLVGQGVRAGHQRRQLGQRGANPLRHRLPRREREARLGGEPVDQPAQRRRDVRVRRGDAGVGGQF